MKNSKELLNVLIKDERKIYSFIMIVTLTIILMGASFFVLNNKTYKNKVIANIVNINENKGIQGVDKSKKLETVKIQKMQAIIKNGKHKGEKIYLENVVNASLTFGSNYKLKDEIIVLIRENNKKIVSANILDFKRDKYIAWTAMIFIILIISVGGFKGFRSLISVIINIAIFYILIRLLLNGNSPFLVALGASAMFVITSIWIVSGINAKSTSAIIGTTIGTMLSIVIVVIVMHLSKSNGIGYKEGEFLAHLPQKAKFTFEQIFLIEILIGNLGAIMDIAISISSAIAEIYDKNPNIQRKELINSGLEIGKDIMGTMANTLIFAYISGSIPLILILINYGMPFFSIINIDMSTEIIRALCGSIGIVLSIPVTIYVSVFFIEKYKGDERK